MIAHHTVIYQREEIQSKIVVRPGERKLGERMVFLKAGETMAELKPYADKGIRYALLGIPESIGVMANFGKCCTDNAWEAFLNFFLNVQSNRFLTGDQIVCLGHIDTHFLNHSANLLDDKHPQYMVHLRKLCAQLDDLVYPVIEMIVRAGILPVVIGGGHNNAYPILKGTAMALGTDKGIQCINCDPHADFRSLEGRHSGNGFSYAFAEGYLSRYAIVGLHESYNSEAVLQQLDQYDQVTYSVFDPAGGISAGLEAAIAFLNQAPDLPVGVELDMDSIINMPASFIIPSGYSVEEARIYIRKTSSRLQTAYLHLPEGAPRRHTAEEIGVGKTLAYLVADFMRARDAKQPPAL